MILFDNYFVQMGWNHQPDKLETSGPTLSAADVPDVVVVQPTGFLPLKKAA